MNRVGQYRGWAPSKVSYEPTPSRHLDRLLSPGPLLAADVRLPSDQRQVLTFLDPRQMGPDVQITQSRPLAGWQLPKWGAWPSRAMMLTMRSKSWPKSHIGQQTNLLFTATVYIHNLSECLMEPIGRRECGETFSHMVSSFPLIFTDPS